jgi:sensor histidine kinase regulating citrate/malate metabolism
MGKESTVITNDKLWYRFFFFPVFTILTITAMIATTGGIRKDQYYEDSLFIFAIGLAIMNVVVFYLINGIIKQEAELHEKKLLEIQIKNQTDKYQIASENFDKQRKKTHEYKNQIICIESLISSKKYSELEEYVRGISGRLTKDLDSIHSNNVIVDAILNTKYQEMLEKDILFVFKINDLSKLIISEEDIVIILSNLLSNAIEACEKCEGLKTVKLKFTIEDDNTIISVKNTHKNVLVFHEGQIQTTKKEDVAEHGVGVKNIIEVILKYKGSYAIQNDNQEFSFSILIPLL